MRKILILVFILNLGFDFYAHALNWESSVERGLEAAQKSGKPVFIDFYVDWCGWCKKLDREVYTDAEVQKIADQFVFVKVNCEKDEATARKYYVEGFPTMVFLSPQGKVIDRIDGFVEKGVLVKYLNDIIQKVGPPKPSPNLAADQKGKVTASGPEYAKAEKFFELGAKMEQIGRKPQAINFYSKASQMAPGTPLADKADDRIKRLKADD